MMDTPYTLVNGKVCVSYRAMAELGMSLQNFKKIKRNARKLNLIVIPGGNGRQALLDFRALPRKWQQLVLERYGEFRQHEHPLEMFFEIDVEARRFYEGYVLWDADMQGERKLSREHVEQYTINASVLNAVIKLRRYREEMTVRLGNARRSLWGGLSADVNSFNSVLERRYGLRHTLPRNVRKLQNKVSAYVKGGYEALIDRRLLNNNAQVVTPLMLQLWRDMFAGRPFKPSHVEVFMKYEAFLNGEVEVINTETGELYDRNDKDFHRVSERTVYRWMERWEFRAPAYLKRSRNRQLYMGQYIPHAVMEAPKYAGSLISVDDFQPPFKYAEGGGNRMWWYIAVDVASTAITSWVYGTSKEGIIEEFYRNLVRQYAEYGVRLPYGIETESNLSNRLKEDVLKPGVLFQDVRIIANDARQKRVERVIGDFKQKYLYKEEGAILRPHARAERFQGGGDEKEKIKSKEEIIEIVLRAIESWNNELHPDQEKYRGLTRWEVFMEKQHPELQPINWFSVLRAIGYETKTRCKLARVRLQNAQRVLGDGYGNLLLGDRLIGVLKQIEGKEVVVRWLDDSDGRVMKAFVYDQEGRFVCELLDELRYQRAKLEQTEEDRVNMALMAQYRNTVEGFIRRSAREINRIEIIERSKEEVTEAKKKFTIKRVPRIEELIRTGEGIEVVNEQESGDDEFVLISEEAGFKINTIDRL